MSTGAQAVVDAGGAALTRMMDRVERRMAEDTTHDTLVAIDGDKIMGYVHFGPYRDGDALDLAIGEVVAIYVDPDQWGTGTGRLLMDAAPFTSGLTSWPPKYTPPRA